jgi:hypothetical protein
MFSLMASDVADPPETMAGMMIADQDVRQCPFCGSAARAGYEPPTDQQDRFSTEFWWVGCERCGVYFSGDTCDDALSLWNRRA